MSYIGQLERRHSLANKVSPRVRNGYGLLEATGRVAVFVWLCGCSLSDYHERRSTTYYYGNGNKQFRFETENGARTGLFTRWYQDGTIESECERRSESLLRRCKYYFPEGTLFRETEYSQDGRSGIEREWFSNGTLRSEGRTKDRQRAGLWYFWSRDGEEAWTVRYANGAIHSVEPVVEKCPVDNEIETQTRERNRHFLTSYWCAWSSQEVEQPMDSTADTAGDPVG